MQAHAMSSLMISTTRMQLATTVNGCENIVDGLFMQTFLLHHDRVLLHPETNWQRFTELHLSIR